MLALLLGLALSQVPDLRPADPWATPGLRPEVLAPCPVRTEDRWRWTTGDTVAEGLVLGLIAADWYQTRTFRAAGYREANPVLGPYPSRARVNVMIGSAMLGHVVVARLLPKPYRGYWQFAVGGAEFATVSWNWDAGWAPAPFIR